MVSDVKPKSDREAVKLLGRIVARLRVIADREDRTISEVAEEFLDAPVDRRYRRVVDEMHAELGEAGA